MVRIEVYYIVINVSCPYNLAILFDRILYIYITRDGNMSLNNFYASVWLIGLYVRLQLNGQKTLPQE